MSQPFNFTERVVDEVISSAGRLTELERETLPELQAKVHKLEGDLDKARLVVTLQGEAISNLTDLVLGLTGDVADLHRDHETAQENLYRLWRGENG